MNTRNRTPSEYIEYGLYFYFSGLSLRKHQKDYILFYQTKPCFYMELDTKINQKNIISKRKKIAEFIIDETLIKVGSELIWLDGLLSNH